MPIGAIILSLAGLSFGLLAFIRAVKSAEDRPTPRIKELGFAAMGMLFIICAGVIMYFENR